jgi:GntR family transcriptional repressor for pyruvate dehydrogenase complex
MKNDQMLQNLSKIEVKSAVDLIIYQIRELIKSGAIKSGDKLPPERKLAEHFGVSKHQVCEAINKLQACGIVTISPQSGIKVNEIGMLAFEGLLSNILDMEKPDFISLVDTRILLEIEAVKLAAINRTEDHIKCLSKALKNFEFRYKSSLSVVEQDLQFHIKIAEASGNSVIKSLMRIITPDIIKSYNKLRICDSKRPNNALEEHESIFEAILNQDSEMAIRSMRFHLEGVVNFSV